MHRASPAEEAAANIGSALTDALTNAASRDRAAAGGSVPLPGGPCRFRGSVPLPGVPCRFRGVRAASGGSVPLPGGSVPLPGSATRGVSGGPPRRGVRAVPWGP